MKQEEVLFNLYSLMQKLVSLLEEDLSQKNKKTVVDSMYKLSMAFVQLSRMTPVNKDINSTLSENDEEIIDKFLNKKK